MNGSGQRSVKPGTAKRAIRIAAPHAGTLTLFLLVVVVDAAIGVVNPFIYRDIINNGILKGDASLVVRLAALVALLAVFDAAFGMAQSYLASKTSARILLSLRVKLFEHIQSMPLAFFVRARAGALVSRLNNDAAGAQSAFTDVLSNVVGNGVSVCLIVAGMFAMSWRITTASLALLPIFILSARLWGRKLQAITREGYELSAAMNDLMVERFDVAGAQLAKLFGDPAKESRSFESRASRVADIGVQRAIYGRLFYAALTLMAFFATALALGWGGVLAVEHRLDVGTVIALITLLSRLYSPLIGLSNAQVDVMTALVSFERVFEALDLTPMIREKPRATTVPKGPARICFDRVSFRYPTASEVSLGSFEALAAPEKVSPSAVLREITFSAEPGQLVALVGPSGAGKTTLTQLVTRLYDVQGGSVSINGVDVRDATLDSLRRRIGLVSQDAHLFQDTIRANLLYAKPDATVAEIEQALRAAQILPLVESLPNGLDTLVGDRGYRFSGGEKQRLAIARVLLKAPEIVILDEATAHLDSESEFAIQKAFETALSGRTALVIAHRLSTILKADQILVIEEGLIRERGTHTELLRSQGLYAELYRRQFAATERSLDRARPNP